METRDLLRQRLANQHLAHPRLTQPAELVAWLGAVQAQDYPAAQWALAQRLVGATDISLEAAFNAGAILRTHVLRPTWHFVAPADLRWLLALTAPRVKARLAPYDRRLGLDAPVRQRAYAVFTQALQGGQPRTRPELDRALHTAGLRLNGQGLAHLVMHAELDALICSGPRRGQQFTYMLLDERVPPAPAISRPEALLALTERYFTSHGPAQAPDFAWWSGLTLDDAKHGLALAGARLARETLGGKDFWFAPSPPARMPPMAYLLPNYDGYMLAYQDRSHFYDPAAFANPSARDNVPFANMIVRHGRIIGLWKRTLTRHAVRVTTKFLQPPTAAEQRAVQAALQRYGQFLGLAVVAS